ncbi:cupredoxin family copper-binding protein [Caballeronia sp. Lep1P3]|uniref:cupredoxin domain-containing protein n=1 Tax=Caballeronia sp. Lep1P3 TaxID=2878150 RepID=UPI001FD53CC5|nr:cupredoxin family copper-binding protein [Caballeronia sp. Lep1P3]
MRAAFVGQCVRQLAVAFIVKGLVSTMSSACAQEPAQQVAAVAAPTISIDNFAFSQATLTVPAGTRVTWINRDDMLHTVVDEAKSFKSDPLDSGDSFSYVFDKPGTYKYFCSLHPHMTGTIVVR